MTVDAKRLVNEKAFFSESILILSPFQGERELRKFFSIEIEVSSELKLSLKFLRLLLACEFRKYRDLHLRGGGESETRKPGNEVGVDTIWFGRIATDLLPKGAFRQRQYQECKQVREIFLSSHQQRGIRIEKFERKVEQRAFPKQKQTNHREIGRNPFRPQTGSQKIIEGPESRKIRELSDEKVIGPEDFQDMVIDEQQKQTEEEGRREEGAARLIFHGHTFFLRENIRYLRGAVQEVQEKVGGNDSFLLCLG